MLPLKMYTHPYEAPLNLATMMPSWSNPTDLGPKTYIAYGQVEEHGNEEGDSVTKLHQVRNLRACIKVAVDFVSPESLAHCEAMSRRLAKIPKKANGKAADSYYADNLQGKMIMLSGPRSQQGTKARAERPKPAPSQSWNQAKAGTKAKAEKPRQGEGQKKARRRAKE
eukprot:gene14386-20387_t